MTREKKRVTRKYDRLKYEWLHLARNVVIVIVITLLVLNIVVGLSRVDGQSMVPTLKNKQVVMYWRLGENYKRGDIVAIKMPSGDKYVKRIVGVPGDVINIKDGFVYLNGKKLSENFVKDGNGSTEPENKRIKYPHKVEANSYWVMRDNRYGSVDSRQFGSVIKDDIKGKLLFQE